MVAVSDLHKWLYELLQPISRLEHLQFLNFISTGECRPQIFLLEISPAFTTKKVSVDLLLIEILYTCSV